MIAPAQGLLTGAVLGLCVAPLWTALKLPMRVCDLLDAGTPRLCALALTLGAMLGTASLYLALPMGDAFGVLSIFAGGVFVGMLASALAEVLNVVPALFDRLSITTDMRVAGWALTLGKMLGAALITTLGGG